MRPAWFIDLVRYFTSQSSGFIFFSPCVLNIKNLVFCNIHRHSIRAKLISNCLQFQINAISEFAELFSLCFKLGLNKYLDTKAFVCFPLEVHKIEIFFGFDFEICIISLLVMSKY